MATAPNFASVLDTPSSAIEKPKPLPVGTYVCVVKGLPRIDKSSKKQTEYSEYALTILEAGEDVDADDLEKSLTKPSGEKIALSAKSLKVTFYHTEDSIYRLKKFLNDLDVPEEEDGEELTIRQRMNEVNGRQVKVTIKHTASEDGENIYANVGGTAKMDA